MGTVVKGAFRKRGEKTPAVDTTTKKEIAPERKTKKETGGNSKPDVAWLIEVKAEITEVTEEDRPKGFLYDVKYRWSGLQEDLNPDFFTSLRLRADSPTTRWCTGPAYVRDERGGYVVDAEWVRLRRPCLSTPAIGAAVCYRHGAQIPHIQAAAKQRIAEAAEVVAMRLVGLTDLRDEDGELISHKDRISAINSTLDRAGVKGGTEVEVSIPGYKKVLDDLFGDDSASES